MKKEYNIKNGNLILCESNLSKFWFIGDGVSRDDFADKELKEYFHSSFDIFVQYLNRFKNLDNRMNEKEERLLKFLLDSLIYAKQSLQESKEDRH